MNKAQVKVQLLDSAQLDAALALLRWCDEVLSENSGVSVAMISRFRVADGAGPRRQETGRKLHKALEDAGVRFVQRGATRGVELRKTAS